MKKFWMSLVASLALYIGIAQDFPAVATDVSPLLIGETVPDNVFKTQTGDNYNLYDNMKGKKTILVFYRGGWCPFCTRQLADLATVSEDLTKMGYQILAISPDQPIKMSETAKKTNTGLTLLSDGDGSFSSALGIAFQAPTNYAKVLKDNTNPNYIPVPTVMIINEQGKILYEYINPDYKTRLPAELLKLNAAYFVK